MESRPRRAGRSKAHVLAIGVGLVCAAVAALPAAARPPGTNGQITFARFNPDLGDTQVYVVNPDGSGQRLVQAATDTGECPTWSPDGTRISTCGGPGGFPGSSSRIINPDDASFEVVPNPDPANMFLPCAWWSRDGTRLACEGFGLTDPSLNGIYTVRPTAAD